MALSYVAFGVNEYAARFPSALLAFLGIAAVYLFVRKRHGESTGIAAGFVLLTSLLFLRLARDAMAEIPLTFFSLLALLAFIKAQEGEERYYTWFGVGTGLAILSKSALGLLPLMIAGLFFITTGRWRKLFSAGFIRGGIVAVVVAALWYVPVLLIHGDVFIQSHFGAYLGTHTFNGHHAGLGIWGVFFYLLWLPLHYLPWIVALLPSLVWALRRWKDEVEVPALWLAVVVPVVALSLITSKYTRYLTPIFPPAAMLIAITWQGRFDAAKQEKLIRGIGWLSLVVAIGVIVLPVSLALDRNNAIREISASVLNHSNPEQKVYNYRLDLWSYRAPLLFYSDHLLTLPVDDGDVVFSDIKPGEKRLILASSNDSGELLNTRHDGIDVAEIASVEDLILLEVNTPPSEVLAEELQQFAPLIDDYEPSRLLGNYRIAHDDLDSLVRRKLDVSILRSSERPKLLFRYMMRRGTSTGIAWRGSEDRLARVADGTYNIRFLAYSEHLVLFTIEQIAADSGENL
jgi:hypothetical protein